MADGREKLTDAVKVSVFNSGALANLKEVSHDKAASTRNDDLDKLTQQAQAAMENIQQLLDSGKLDDGASQKLTAALSKLRSALGKDGVSRAALATALAEASSAVGSTDGAGKNLTPEQKTELLWQKIEAANKDIDDDFEKMRKAGVNFNDKLWNKHKELMEYLQAHPHDIQKQKELMAVDDVLLMQAEPQIMQHPEAKTPFDDAKNKSKDRREAVDQVQAINAKSASITSADFDEDVQTSTKNQSGNLTLNDVVAQAVGQKQKSTGKQHS